MKQTEEQEGLEAVATSNKQEIERLRIKVEKLEQKVIKLRKVIPLEDLVTHTSTINDMYQQILAQKTVLTELRFMLRDDPRQGEYLSKAIRALDYVEPKWWVSALSVPLKEVMVQLDHLEGVWQTKQI